MIPENYIPICKFCDGDTIRANSFNQDVECSKCKIFYFIKNNGELFIIDYRDRGFHFRYYPNDQLVHISHVKMGVLFTQEKINSLDKTPQEILNRFLKLESILMNCKLCNHVLSWSRYDKATCEKCHVEHYRSENIITCIGYSKNKDFKIYLYLYNDTLSVFYNSGNNSGSLDYLITNAKHKWDGRHPKKILDRILKMRAFL